MNLTTKPQNSHLLYSIDNHFVRKGNEEKKGELSNNIYLKLKEMIYSGYLKPHETLNLKELAKVFNTSLTPINAALSILSEEGLVIKRPNKSAVVASMSIEEIKDIWLTGALLEGMAAYLAASRITSDEIKSMEEILEKTKELKIPDEIAKLKELNQVFHGIFLRACKNKELLGSLRESSLRLYRYHVLAASLQGAVSDFIRQHGLIIDHLKKGDPKGTRDAVEEHIISEGEKVIKCLEIGIV